MTSFVVSRKPFQLAILASHPIQYQVPLFRALAARPEIELRVFFCCRMGLERYQDPGFGLSLSWDIPMLEGYSYVFLRNLSHRAGSSRFLDILNPGIASAILRGNFDAIWIHGWALATNWIAWACASAFRVPILLRGEANGLNEPTGIKRKVKQAVLKTFFTRVAAFLAIGSNNARFYRSYGVPEERIFFTPYSVD